MPFVAERITKCCKITLDGSLSKVFPLFGPVDEAKWAPGWTPKVLYPAAGRMEEHLVFQTTHDHGVEPFFTWIISKYQPEISLVEYTVCTSLRIWYISIRCSAIEDSERTVAEVSYTYTGLTDEGNRLNRVSMDLMFARNLKDWEEQINLYLQTEPS